MDQNITSIGSSERDLDSDQVAAEVNNKLKDADDVCVQVLSICERTLVSGDDTHQSTLQTTWYLFNNNNSCGF